MGKKDKIGIDLTDAAKRKTAERNKTIGEHRDSDKGTFPGFKTKKKG